MKKYLLLIGISLFLGNKSKAQGIIFESGSFTEALVKARTENKLLFVDVYTSWCGPCKRMSQETFTQTKLGNYFNRNFINYKQDGEKNDGPELMKKFDITTVPTFLFLDGDGKLVLKLHGFHDAKDFLNIASNIDFFLKYGGSTQVEMYKKGSGTVEFFKDYYEIAPEKEKPVLLNRYLSAMSDDQLLSEQSASLIGSISVYNYDLFLRIAKGIAKVKSSASFDYLALYISPFENMIATYLEESINEGRQERFRQLLEIKHILDQSKQKKDDIQYTLITASRELLNLWYDAQNRVNPEGFAGALEQYMDKLVSTHPIDSLREDCRGIAYRINHPDTSWLGKIMQDKIDYHSALLLAYRPIANLIVDWTGYYWRLSPSGRATRERCITWLKYACEANPYNPETIIRATPLLIRLKQKKAVVAYLEEIISSLQSLKRKEPEAIKKLQNTLEDVKNDKF